MKISFFEEHPSPENLDKLRTIPFKTDVYIAAKTLTEFLVLKNRIKSHYRQVEKVIYWPVLNPSEGYWLSALAKTSALVRTIEEIKSSDEYILWDAEVPWLNKTLYIKNVPYVLRNRLRIKEILFDKRYSQRLIVTAFPRRGIASFVTRFLCASFSKGNFSYIDMLYSSLMTESDKQTHLKSIMNQSKHNFFDYKVALGLIGRGEEDHITPLISPTDLERDLLVAKSEGISEVVLYRLGGLNEEYLKTLKRFSI